MSAVLTTEHQRKIEWQSVTLSDVAHIVNGGTPKSNIAGYWAGGVPWLTPKDMGKMGGREIAATPRTISERGLANSSARLIPANSVILSTRAPIGHLAINKVPMAFNQGCRGIVPNADLDHVYLYYFLSAHRKLLDDLGVGATFKELSATNLRSVRLPLPPLDEQKRIVSVLDQALAALDRARAHAEANLADCRNLFAAAVSAVVKRESNNQQRRLRLGSIVTRLTNGYVGPISNVYVESGVPYLLARQVRDNTLVFDGRTYVTQKFNDKHKKSKLRAGDVLLVQSGHIGHSAVVPAEHEGHNCHAMIVITPVDDVVSGSYLSALFNTPEMQDAFQNIRTGSTVPHLTCKMVKELMIELPPRPVQDKIIQVIETLRARSEIAKQRYKADVADLANLRQSLLQKAFSGQLT